jgi:hypothetical protein
MTPSRCWWLTLLAVGGLACASPEALRARGGGPGADTGNRPAVTEIHGGAEMYYRTPCRLPTDCTGAAPGT